MKRITLFLIGGSFFLLGCQTGTTNALLEKADSLVIAEKYDSAYNIVHSLNESDILNEEETAHYLLLKVQTAYLVNKPLESSDSLLDIIIEYYQKELNYEKLADAYYYKAFGLYLAKDFQQSMLYHKKAEKFAKDSKNLRLQYKIVEGIFFLNGVCANYDLQLTYAKKAFLLSKKINKKKWIVDSYYYISYAFSKLGKEDSVVYYLNQIKSNLIYIDKRHRSVFLTSLAYLLKEQQPNEAKRLLFESISYQEKTTTYEYLAELLYKEGNVDEACKYWEKALTINDLTPKDNVIHNLIEYDIERGKIDKISNRVTEIIAIRDSIDALLRNDTIKDLQTKFDHEVAMHEKDQTIIKWQRGIIILTVILLGFIGYFLRKKYLNKIELQGYQMQIHDSMEQIRELETANKQLEETNLEQSQEFENNITANLKKIDELNRHIKGIMDNKAPRLDQGRMLYDDIVKNTKMKRWEKENIQKFLDYYGAVNYRKLEKIKKIPRAEKLTDFRLFFLILVDMGKTDEEILWIMSISKDTLRVYRNRTRPLKT